jgi:hypothetical protein
MRDERDGLLTVIRAPLALVLGAYPSQVSQAH